MQLYKNFCKETTDENGKLTSFELVFPENYNFGYDVVDKMAELVPNDTAVVWTNPEKEEKIFTYSDISRLSNKAANVFRNHGIKKGDKVALVGFGTFETRKRAARMGHNIRTKEPMKIAATTVPAFKPGISARKYVP